jgi:hypothetical protein
VPVALLAVGAEDGSRHGFSAIDLNEGAAHVARRIRDEKQLDVGDVWRATDRARYPAGGRGGRGGWLRIRWHATADLRDIQLPLAMPTIMAGVNQVIMLALSMAVIAGLVGPQGLGGQVTSAIATLNIALGFEAGLAVVILAIYLDRVTGSLGTGGGTGGLGRKLARLLGFGRQSPGSAEQPVADEAPSDEVESEPVTTGTRT